MATDEQVVPENDSKLQDQETSSVFVSLFEELIYSPTNIILLITCAVLMYKLFFSGGKSEPSPPPTPELKPLKRQDFKPSELRQYDGTGPDGRVCVAVNGQVFDVTKGKRFYGPGGPYNAFAGRDASRGLATFTVEAPKEDEYDDLSDLNPMEMEGVKEWEMQFKEKYHYVGRLLRPGEEPTEYSDEDDAERNSKKEGLVSNPIEADGVKQRGPQLKEKAQVAQLLKAGGEPTESSDNCNAEQSTKMETITAAS